MHVLNFTNKVIDYTNEAVLPFYVLHHPVIVVIAFYTLPWDINLGIKFLFVSTAALVATLVLYDLLIRRWNGTRWLFGMKPLTPRKSEQEPTIDSTPTPPLKI
jgi:glucans biosynthesis protein C